MKRYPISLLVTGILISVFAASTLETGINQFSSRVSDSVYSLPEVVITAARIEQPVTEVSTSLMRVTGDRLRFSATNDVARILESEPGLTIRSYPSLKSASSIGLWGTTSQQVLVTIDGHPVTNVFTGQADIGMISLNNTKAIEILKGAGSSVYGANALGGTVNFLSETPSAHAPGSSWHRMRAAIGSSGNGSLGYTTGVRYSSLGFSTGIEQDAATGTRGNERSQVLGGTVGVGYYPARQLRCDLSLSSIRRELGLPGPQPDPAAIPRFGDSLSSSLYDHELDHIFDLRGDLRWLSSNNAFTFELKPDWNATRTRYWMLSPWATTPESISHDNYSSQRFGNALIITGNADGLGQVVAGYDIRYEQGGVQSAISDTFWQATSLSHGVWTQLLLNVPATIHSQLGLRLDLNSDYGQILNPGIGFAWTPSPRTKFRLNLGSAFRAPTFSDRYWPVSGVRNIRPERGISLQTGTDLILSSIGSVSLTGFLRRTNDLILWLPDTGGLWRPTNVDSAHHSGIEFAGTLQPVTGLNLRLAATWLKGTQFRRELTYYDFMTGESRFAQVIRPMAFLPVFSLTARGEYSVLKQVTLVISSRFSSRRQSYYPIYHLDGSVRTEVKQLTPYLVFDAETQLRLFPHFILVPQVSNILNTRYAQQFGNSLTDRDYPMPGRTFALLLRYDRNGQH